MREAAIDGDQRRSHVPAARNHCERSLWTFPEQPARFEHTHLYFHGDQVAQNHWRRRLVDIQLPIASYAASLAQVKQQIQKLYQREGRGRYCTVDYSARQQPLLHCFFSWREDHAHCDTSRTERGLPLTQASGSSDHL